MNQDVQLTAYRYAVWGGPDGSESLVYLGENMTDARFAWSFSESRGGAVCFTLENANAGEQGLCPQYYSDYEHPVSGRTMGATVLLAQIDEETLEQVSAQVAPGETVSLFHTLYVTRSDGAKQVELVGTLDIKQGAPN
ncbi:hypothetical protein MTR62_10575 [Novosphingobium sp. 1949]|uniref:Lipocalin-like domain-containing protein n=1 Tax=Novosphingobium organovorum TaxID=2930092 RepID=A0ABT0BDI5_9SPHN|nr:hypothetical protein [Novosphingobium organovorum]MCJ2183132.1 hypothetical protein [Novosphingobium organovorum]